jgi:hypothetical protein
LQNGSFMNFLLAVLIFSGSKAPAYYSPVKLKSKPPVRLTVGKCQDKAVLIVNNISTLNGDSVITTSDKVGHKLDLAVPNAVGTILPDKTELWRVSLDFNLDEKGSTVLMRQVVYELIMAGDQGGFCTILQVKRQDKQDYFTEIR